MADSKLTPSSQSINIPAPIFGKRYIFARPHMETVMTNQLTAGAAWKVASCSTVFAALCAIVLYLLLPDSAFAEPRCAPHDKMVKLLKDKFRELPANQGMIGRKQIMQTFRSQKGTWSIVITDTKMYSCLMATGQDWSSDDDPDFLSLEPES